MAPVSHCYPHVLFCIHLAGRKCCRDQELVQVKDPESCKEGQKQEADTELWENVLQPAQILEGWTLFRSVPKDKDVPRSWSVFTDHRIISTGLEKTFKVNKSNRSPALSKPLLTHVTEGLVYTICEHLQGQ